MRTLPARLRNPSADLLYGLVAAGIILIAAVVRGTLANRVAAPNILCDEFIYAGIARGLSEGDGYAYRGTDLGFSYIYPLLVAPAWWASSMETTFELVKAVNVAVMSLAGVPAYLWARRLASPPWALVATVLVLLIPAFTFNGLVMTENAAYTTFLVGAFAIALALERPTVPYQTLALVAIAVAWATRFQSVVLLPAFFVAAVLKLALDARAGVERDELRTRALQQLRPLVALAVLAGGYALYKRVTTGLFASVLGPYVDLRHNKYPVGGIVRWGVLHLGELALAVAVVPMAALVVLVLLGALGRSRSDAERAFVAVAVSLVLLVAVQVGAFATSTADWVVERYSFYAMPLLLLALVAWLGRGAPRRPIGATVAGAGLSVGLVAWLLHEFRDTLFAGSLPVNTLSLYAFLRWPVHFDGDQDRVVWAVTLAALAVGVAFVLLPLRGALVLLPLGVAATLVVFSRPAFHHTQLLSEGSFQLAGANPTWVDDRVGRDARVALIVTPHPDQFNASAVQLQTEFWNRSVRRFHRLGQAEICPLPGDDLVANDVTGRLERIAAPGSPSDVTEPYVVVHRGTAVHGELLAEGGTALGSPLSLYRVLPPLRLATAVQGIFADGWMGSEAVYTQYAGTADSGTIEVALSRAAWTGPDKPGRVVIRYGRPVTADGIVEIASPRRIRWVIHSGASRAFRIPASSLPVRVEVVIKPTFSPADYGQVDARQLGAQVTFSYVPES